MSLLWKSDQEDGTYKNPILFADYSDPDVIRVGDIYYMTASSFNYVPGLPILTFTTECRMRAFTWCAQKMHLESGKNRYLC